MKFVNIHIEYGFTFLLLILSCHLFGQDFENSGNCQNDNNANCDKWWTSLENNKRAVFVINSPLLNGNRSQCTGTLINQITADNKLQTIFITARHCIEGKDFSKPWDFYFNYQSPTCDNNDVPKDNENGGRYLHQSKVTLIDDIRIVDVALLKMEKPIPPHFNVYYSGWTLANLQTIQLPHHVIHHPRGDIKKIAKTFGTVTVTNYTCHTVTTVIDAVFSWFGISVNTERICSLVELPQYSVSVWSDGVVEHGSSGSALLNRNSRIIGILSWGAGSCDFPALDQFGRFNTAWVNSKKMRNTLNPNGDYILTGISGRQKTYDNLLDLNGDYYPAKDYQRNNQIVMKAKNKITTNGRLTIHTDADFTFESGKSITLKPGFSVQAGANFSAKVGTSANKSKIESEEDRIKDIIASIPIPEYKEFSTNKLKSTKLINTEYCIEKQVDISVYPNPVNDILNIEYNLNKTNLISIILINPLGFTVKEVASNQKKNKGIHKKEIFVGDLESGVYFLVIWFGKTKHMEKIIIN